MLKKLLVDASDLKTIINDWTDERANNLENKIKELENDKEQTYLVGLDLASESSKDYSVMIKFRIVDGRYIYEGFELV